MQLCPGGHDLAPMLLEHGVLQCCHELLLRCIELDRAQTPIVRFMAAAWVTFNTTGEGGSCSQQQKRLGNNVMHKIMSCTRAVFVSCQHRDLKAQSPLIF